MTHLYSPADLQQKDNARFFNFTLTILRAERRPKEPRRHRRKIQRRKIHSQMMYTITKIYLTVRLLFLMHHHCLRMVGCLVLCAKYEGSLDFNFRSVSHHDASTICLFGHFTLLPIITDNQTEPSHSTPKNNSSEGDKTTESPQKKRAAAS